MPALKLFGYGRVIPSLNNGRCTPVPELEACEGELPRSPLGGRHC